MEIDPTLIRIYVYVYTHEYITYGDCKFRPKNLQIKKYSYV